MSLTETSPATDAAGTAADAPRPPATPAAPAAPVAAATPGPREIETRHGPGFVPKKDRTLVEGEGVWLRDADGRWLLDFAAGHGVAALGHAHPRWAAAVGEQAARLATCPDSFPTPRRAELLERLVGLLPVGLDRVFLGNSGAESVEAALKVARASTGRPGVVALRGGFHGRTFGALSATAKPAYRTPFEPLVPGFGHVSVDDVDGLRAAVTDETAAVVLELVQGEGGVRPLSRAFVDAAREVCDATGALLVVDEVQTGFGRTGRLFACEHHDLTPDILCMGKALAGGLPMSATAFGPRVGPLAPGSHGSTFGGNPLACAAALATLDVIEDEQLPARAERLGALARQRLTEAVAGPGGPVREVRGPGLMIGLELRRRLGDLVPRLLEHGLVTLPAGPNVLRLLPPLVIGEDELGWGLERLVAVLRGRAG